LVFGPSGRQPQQQQWQLQQCREQRQLVEFFAQWRQCLEPELEQQQSRHQPEQQQSTKRLFGQVSQG
jgi:hypothetical protein